MNANDRVLLSGSLTAFNDQNTSWTVDDESLDLDAVSLTPIAKDFNGL